MRGGKSVSANDKRRLITAFNRGDDYVVVANALGIKKDTAYRIIKRNSTSPHKRGGFRSQRVKVTEQIRHQILKLVDKNCGVTLQQISNDIKREFEVDLSDTTISRVLEGALYTMKRCMLIPEARNSQENKMKRKEYATWYQSVSDENIIFLDESGFDLWQSRTRGRSLKGKPAKRIVSNQRLPHLTLMLAISSDFGNIYHTIKRGGTKKEDMTDFVKEVLHETEALDVEHPILVIDNAPCHRGLEDSLRIEGIPIHTIKRLPPYSCELNPIENVFNIIKANCKQLLTDMEDQREDGESKVSFRLRKLSEALNQSIGAVTQRKVNNSYRHCLAKVIPRALEMMDL